MTLEELKNQLQLHWTTKFTNYYWVDWVTVNKYVWTVWRQYNKPKPEFPPTNLSKSERNKIFYETIDVEKYWNYIKGKEKMADNCKRIVREYQEPTPEKYTGRFAFAFYKL